MTQLIINDIELPETWSDKYSAAPAEKSVQLRMSDLTFVEEVVGSYMRITYSYDRMNDAVLRPLLAALRSGGVLEVWYLPDDGDDLVYGEFLCTEKPVPKFGFSDGGAAKWHSVSFVLEGVEALA